MADALAAAGRAFVKPLNYDGGGVHPDLVLVDKPETYVEAGGMRDPLPDLSGKQT